LLASSSSLGTMKDCHFLKLSSFSSCAAIGRPRNIPKVRTRIILIETPPGRAGRRHHLEVMPPSTQNRAGIIDPRRLKTATSAARRIASRPTAPQWWPPPPPDDAASPLPAATVIQKLVVAVAPMLSVTWTVKLDVP